MQEQLGIDHATNLANQREVKEGSEKDQARRARLRAQLRQRPVDHIPEVEWWDLELIPESKDPTALEEGRDLTDLGH